jgi:hypothetical protein
MLVFGRADILHRGRERDELVLRRLPLPLIDQLLDLGELRRRQGDLVVTGHPPKSIVRTP